MTLTQISSRGVEDTLRWSLGSIGSVAYTFTGPGLTGTVSDPTIYLTRGQTYIFENNTSSGAHPFYIKTSTANGGTNDAYNTGVTNNGGGGGTEIKITVPHDAPDILYYQCSSHSSMNGIIYITGAVADGSITSTKIADDTIVNADVNASAAIAGSKIVPTFTGTDGVKLPVGTTEQRTNTQGMLRFNTTLGLAEYYNGTAWISIDAPPTVTSCSPTVIDSTVSGNASIVVSGSNFSTGATVKFISNTGTTLTASSVARDSSTQLTATIARSSFVNAQEPYDVRVTNSSNLSNTLPDAITVDSSPVFTTPAGQIGGGFTGDSYSYTVAATDADGETVSYSLQSGSLPTGGSLNSSTGVISGTHPSVGSTTTFSFTIRATANGVTADRAFSIQSIVASAPTFYTSSGTFTLNAPQAVIVTVIGGGGGGGSTPDGSSGGSGGGGGGMARKEYANLAAGNYTLTVGAGGARTPSDGSSGDGGNGGTSSFAGTGITTVSATGGNGGAASSNSITGTGGSGGTGSNGDTNGTGGQGGNGRTGANQDGDDAGNGTNGGAGGGGGGGDSSGGTDYRSGNGGNGSATYYTGGGASGGMDRNGLSLAASQIGTPGTGYKSGGKGGGMGQTATAGEGNAGGDAGSARGGPTPRNNFGGGGGSYGGGGGGAGSGDDLSYPQSGEGGGGVVAIVM